jgi:hypothetical protein
MHQTTGTDEQKTAEELGGATYAHMTAKVSSAAANALIDDLQERVIAHEREVGQRRYKRTKKAEQFRSALEGFTVDLLRAHASTKAQGWVYRAKRPAGFTGNVVSYRQFSSLIKALVAHSLVQERAGFQRWSTDILSGELVSGGGRKAARFSATNDLLDLCSEHGVQPSDWQSHFLVPLPANPLQLRAKSVRNEYGEKIRGVPWPFKHTDRTRHLEHVIRDLNDFIDGFKLEGGYHRGFIRVFNRGDDPHFNWNMGGRAVQPGRWQFPTVG